MDRYVANARKAIVLVILVGFIITVVGGLLVLIVPVAVAEGPGVGIASLIGGVSLLYMGSHLVWAGIGSLRNLGKSGRERAGGV